MLMCRKMTALATRLVIWRTWFSANPNPATWVCIWLAALYFITVNIHINGLCVMTLFITEPKEMITPLLRKALTKYV